MTRGFWKDPDRYLDTYWARWDGVWVHGDFAAQDADGLWYILGRSDDTIKIAGKRLGPAEVESILVEDAAIMEAAAIGVPHPVKGSELVAFCVLAPGHQPTEALRGALHQRVVEAMGKPLAPKAILFVSDLLGLRGCTLVQRRAGLPFLPEIHPHSLNIS